MGKTPRHFPAAARQLINGSLQAGSAQIADLATNATNATNADNAATANLANQLGGKTLDQLLADLATIYAPKNSPIFTGTPRLPEATTFMKSGRTNEGGQFLLEKAPGTNLVADIRVDMYLDQLRFFEYGTPFRGAHINLKECGEVGSTFLWHSKNLKIERGLISAKSTGAAVTFSSAFSSYPAVLLGEYYVTASGAIPTWPVSILYNTLTSSGFTAIVPAGQPDTLCYWLAIGY